MSVRSSLLGRLQALTLRAIPHTSNAASAAQRPAAVLGAGAWGFKNNCNVLEGLLLQRHAVAALRPGFPAAVRCFSSTSACRSSLDDFYVSLPEVNKDGNPVYPAVGRAWKASELREKSFEDLHKLWWICLKERNSLAGERHQARARGLTLMNPKRWRKIRKTMARIKVVLGERQRMRYLQQRQERTGVLPDGTLPEDIQSKEQEEHPAMQ